jgi:thiamine-monophosphate kinase
MTSARPAEGPAGTGPPDGELRIIREVFAPLATASGADGLLDDVASLHGGDWVVTTDALVAGVHFLPDDPLDLVARKALRVNISDLHAKGVDIEGYLLTLAWPAGRDHRQLEAIAAGLAVDQAHFGCSLMGGDTVVTPGPLMLSVTAFGRAQAPIPRRRLARAGDDLWLTGTIGDAGLGLEQALAGRSGDVLVARYRLPHQVSRRTAAIVREHARAAMDVSDGLLLDAARMGEAAGVGVRIDLGAMPVSPEVAGWLGAGPSVELLLHLATRGDDYCALLAADPARRAVVADALAQAGMPAVPVGACFAGTGLEVLGPGGRRVPAGGVLGWSHMG